MVNKMLDSSWPEDKWNILFNINDDGSSFVKFVIEMAVPDFEERPIDYMNFGETESNFQAFDYESKEKLIIDIKKSDKGQTVYVYPNRKLNLGDKYKYTLELYQPNGMFHYHNGLNIVKWGWGNWPLYYNLEFLLPENTLVYDSSPNLKSYKIENNRISLNFEDHSTYDSQIQIYALFKKRKTRQLN